MEPWAFQDAFAQLGAQQWWGCGRQHAQGLQSKSDWEGEDGVCVWRPQPSPHAWPGRAHGGILAAILDCHCAGTAIAAACRAAHRPITGRSPADHRPITEPPLLAMVTAEFE